MYSKIIGTGSYLPKQVLTNHDLEKLVDTTDAWIIERTGIHSRHVAAPEDNAATMGAAAAREAMAMANCVPESIDLIITATATPNYFFPSTACEIQALLGATCPAFDLQAACSGFIYGLTVADQFIKSGQATTVLVIGSEVMSRLVNWSDRSTCVLFGDGAGACILQRSTEPGILGTAINADGREADLLCVENPQVKYHGEKQAEVCTVDMSGRKVFKIAVSKLEETVLHTLEKHKISASELDWLVPHQANARIIETTREKLQMPAEKVIVTLETHGNTSSASIPLALDTAIRDGRIKKNHLVLLEAFGAGLTWGSALIRI